MKTDVIEIIDCAPTVLPPRSRLYHLEPVRPVTGLVESLTSYIARLAAAHFLPLGVLAIREVAPLFRRIMQPHGSRDLVGTLSAAINGVNNTARETVKAVELLTAQSGLQDLTMLTAEDHLSATPLVRPTQSWCPSCLDEWLTSGQTLYYPLLWNLVAVRICPVHNTGLLDTCHRCNKSHRPASRRQRIGYCPRCSCWLGTAEGQRASAGRQTAAHSEWQVYAANSAVTLIADLALNWQNGGGNESFFAGNLSQITNRLFGGSRGAFATFINCHHKSVKDWIIQAQRPSLKTILVLGYRLGVPASKLLLAPLKADEAVQLRQADKNDEPRLRPSLRRTPREKIEQTLLAALEKGSIPPSSLKSVCVAAGFHSTQASSRFPELSRRISDLHRRYRSERRNQGQRRIRDAVRSAVNELHTAGVYPSRERVQEKLARNVFLRDPVAHAERLAAIRDLGLTVRPRTG